MTEQETAAYRAGLEAAAKVAEQVSDLSIPNDVDVGYATGYSDGAGYAAQKISGLAPPVTPSPLLPTLVPDNKSTSGERLVYAPAPAVAGNLEACDRAAWDFVSELDDCVTEDDTFEVAKKLADHLLQQADAIATLRDQLAKQEQ